MKRFFYTLHTPAFSDRNMPYFHTLRERADYMQDYCRHLKHTPSASFDELDFHINDRRMHGDIESLLCFYSKDGFEYNIHKNQIMIFQQVYPFQGDFHKHQYIEIFYVLRGTFEQILLGEHRAFSEGEVVITDQNCEHADYLSGEDTEVLFLSINPDFMDKLLDYYDGTDDLLHFLFDALRSHQKGQRFLQLKPEKGNAQLEHLFDQLLQEEYAENIGYKEIQKFYLLRILHTLCLDYALQLHGLDKDSKEKVLLYELERFISTHLGEISAKTLEAHFHYHRNYYNLLLKKYRNKNLKTYIQEMRIRQAAIRLRESNDSIHRIAESVGYENNSFFYELFKRQYGISPKDYREKYC